MVSFQQIKQMYFIDVILPLALPNLYTYQVDETEVALISPGMRVAVEFGKEKFTRLLFIKFINKNHLIMNPNQFIKLLMKNPWLMHIS